MDIPNAADAKEVLLRSLSLAANEFVRKSDPTTRNVVYESTVKRTRRGKVRFESNEIFLNGSAELGLIPVGPLDSTKPILVLDCSALSSVTDMLFKFDFMNNIVVAETSLEELRKTDWKSFNKTLVLCGLSDKVKFTDRNIAKALSILICPPWLRMHIYGNRFCKDTYVDPQSESYEVSSVLKVSEYYQQHTNSQVYVITYDTSKYGESSSATILSVTDFGKRFCAQNERFFEHVALPFASECGPLYLPHSTSQEASRLLIQSRVFQGYYRATESPFYGSVIISIPKVGNREIALVGAYNVNRAIDGDLVLIEIINPINKHKLAILDEIENPESIAHLFEEFTPQCGTAIDPVGDYGHVLNIVRRTRNGICGTIKNGLSANAPSADFVEFVPKLNNLPTIFIRASNRELLSGKRLIVNIDEWPQTSPYPIGHWIDNLGNAGDIAVETTVLFRDHGIHTRAFSPTAMASLPPSDFKISSDEINRRLDCRLKYCPCDHCNERICVTNNPYIGTPMFYEAYPKTPRPLSDWKSSDSNQDIVNLRIANPKLEESDLNPNYTGIWVCSIDPNTCVDIDDALSVRFLPNGNYEIGVHIADVTHFVKEGSALDKEASERCTTLYMINTRTDMLPAVLSSNLCSLRSGTDRLALSVFWEMNSQADILNTNVFKTVIHNVASFTYQQAQEIIDDENDKSPIGIRLRVLASMAKIMRKRRMEKGALELADSAVKFTFDKKVNEHGEVVYSESPTSVRPYPVLFANHLIEEFMLQGNISVAKKILEAYPQWSVLRAHPAPIVDRLEKLCQLVRAQGFKIKYANQREFSESLAKCTRADNPEINKLVRMMAVYCMNQAIYVCSGKVGDASQLNHYALATEVYTHFTSPIRRYADILVHRLLSASINWESTRIQNISKLAELCERISRVGLNARLCMRASSDFFSFLIYKSICKDSDHKIIRGTIISISPINVVVFDSTSGIQLKANFDKTLWHYGDGKITSGGHSLAVFDSARIKVIPSSTNYRYHLTADLIN